MPAGAGGAVVNPFGGVSVREALDSAVIAIAAAGSDTPRLDAEVLLAAALGVQRAALFLDPQREVTGPAVRAFQDAVRRRSAGREPVAYITGVRGFRYLELAVDARVLVPRPETELLVEVGLELLPEGVRVVDVGTGSGAIALALAHERPDLAIVATDVSADALAVARANAARLGLDGIEFLAGDLLAGADARPVDAVLSNPPYVAEGDRATLAPEITRHEPPGALFAGADGLDVIRRLVPAAAAAGARLLAIELGEGQAPAVMELMAAAGYERVQARRDLAGIERVVLGVRA
jgi:release factor glutamine methyltransferase